MRKLQVPRISEGVIIYWRKLRACGKNGRNFLPHLAFQYYLSGHRDMGRPKQRWQDQERLQDQEENMLMDLNRSSQNDDDDSNVKNMNWDYTLYFCNHMHYGIHSFIHS